ncbi:MAG: D-glycerate dehydrogenase [Chthonomonadales bacterium]
MSNLPKVFVTRSFWPDVLKQLFDIAKVDVWQNDGPPPSATLAEKCSDANGLLCLLTDRIDRELLDQCPNLKVISQMAVGVDNIDLAACRDRNIPVGNTPGVLAETTADLTFALILSSGRRIVEADAFVRTGKWKTWSPDLLVGPDIHHATIGIVGMGAIGLEVARRAHGFRMEILYASRSRNMRVEAEYGAKYVPLQELCNLSDFVTVHVALTPETKHILGEPEFNLMKPSAVVINTARGDVVDQSALIIALQSQRIWGAGLDVFSKEPLAMDSPLFHLPNVTLLPHIGSASITTRRRMAQLAVANLIAGLIGEPLPHQVT